MASRQPFSSQSILYILLDYVDEKKKYDLDIIHRALESTVVVAASVVGGIRLPGLGVGVLGPPFTRILRLSPVRNNLPGILSSLNSMVDGLTPVQRGTEVSVEVSEALDTVVAEAAAFSLAATHPLQVVVITWGPVHVLTEAFTLLLNHSHARCLRAVHVAGVENILHGALLQENVPAGDAAGGVWVTAASYSPDPYTFTALFKSWLGETKGKEPHIQLIIPAAICEDHQDPLTLLVDMQEIMVNPACLPSTVASRLTINNNIYRTVSTTQGTSVFIVDLEVVKRVTCSSVATALFGQACYLVPTGATSLSFSDIWENKQYVAALCEQLAERDEGLLARVRAAPGAITPLVAIFPATHCSALSMVHVAPAELMLAERHLDEQPQEVPDKVGKELKKRLASLNVSDLRLEDQASYLIPTLTQHFTKTTRGGGPRARQQMNTTFAHVATSGTRNSRPPPQHPAFMNYPQPSTRVARRGGRI
ncbi:uncharacterized protein [Panulirus ornatus]|uniref:uncharacterized protein n=1 Tax=Panulirus ornatus TaxID=150431 RepID=UPI003A8ABE45